MFQINFYHYFSHTGFIQPLEPHNNNNNESYYKQILTEREDVILRETQCDNYYQSGMKVFFNVNYNTYHYILAKI